MKINVRQNSIDRYADMIESGELKGRQAEVVKALVKRANISAQHICAIINANPYDAGV